MILDRTADLHRLQTDPSDSNSEFYRPQVRGFRLNIQPVSAEYSAAIGDTYGRTYRAFTLQSGIRIDDKIAVSGMLTASGMEYIVAGVADWNMPPLPHFELQLTQAGK